MRQIGTGISTVALGSIAIYAQVQARPCPTTFLSFLVLVAGIAVSGHVGHGDVASPRRSLVGRGLASVGFRRAGRVREPGATAVQLLGVLEEYERLLGEWIRLAADSQIASQEDALRRSLEIAAQLDRLGSHLAWLLEEHPEVLAMLQATEDGRAGGSSGGA